MLAESLLLPIGQFGGATGPADDPGTRFQLRLGQRTFSLTTDQFSVWAAAHGTLDRVGVVRNTRAALVSRLVGPQPGASRSTVDSMVDWLGEVGALSEVDSDRASSFAAAHRLAPLLLGLGNSAAEPGRYALGLHDQPVVSVPRVVCTIWEWADRWPDLWSVCAWLAQAQQVSAARVLQDVLEALPGLLAVNAAYLDVAGPDVAGPDSAGAGP